MTTIAHVVALCRYPIKGLSAEALDGVALSRGGGFPDDRAWGFARHGSGFDPDEPKPMPKQKFLTLARDARLAGLDARFDTVTWQLSVTQAGMQTLNADMRSDDGRAAASAFFAELLDIDPQRAPAFVHAGEHRFTDVSVVSETLMNAVSLVNLASVRDLERRSGETIDPARFRANILVDGLEPWAELGLEGREIRLGDIRLRGCLRTKRCAATEVNPRTAERDLRVPRLLVKAFDHADMGVYLEVLGDGELRVGDQVHLAG